MAIRGKRGRPRSNGARYDCGKLMPPGPNDRVVAARRALLGEGDASAKVDLSKAENALDLLLERNWLSEDRHRAARRYGAMWVTFMGFRPGVQVSKAPVGNSLMAGGEGLPRSGVLTPADFALAKAVADFDAGKIDLRALRKAERAHLAARIDWSRLPHEEVLAIFRAALDLDTYHPPMVSTGGKGPPTAEEREAQEMEIFQRIRARLTSAQSDELRNACVFDDWPQWLVWKASGKVVPEHWDRKRKALEHGLDVVLEEIGRKPHEPDVTTQGGCVPQAALPTATDAAAPPRGYQVEHINYVDSEGNLLFEVEKRSRR